MYTSYFIYLVLFKSVNAATSSIVQEKIQKFKCCSIRLQSLFSLVIFVNRLQIRMKMVANVDQDMLLSIAVTSLTTILILELVPLVPR